MESLTDLEREGLPELRIIGAYEDCLWSSSELFFNRNYVNKTCYRFPLDLCGLIMVWFRYWMLHSHVILCTLIITVQLSVAKNWFFRAATISAEQLRTSAENTWKTSRSLKQWWKLWSSWMNVSFLITADKTTEVSEKELRRRKPY